MTFYGNSNRQPEKYIQTGFIQSPISQTQSTVVDDVIVWHFNVSRRAYRQ